MKLLVIGGTRFIGLAVVNRLRAMGHQIAVLNRGQTPVTLPEGVQRITGDMDKLEDSRDAITRFAPDVVLHNMVIHEGHARDMMKVLKGRAGRVVMTSSIDVYQIYGRLHGSEPGAPLPLPVDEDSPLREKWYPYRSQVDDPQHFLYNYDKIPAEQMVMNEPELPGTILRLPMVIGPLDYQRRLYGFVKPMQDGRRAIVMQDGYAHWQSTYGCVDNVAHAMALACVDERAAGRVYNVADVSLSTLELAEKVKAVVNWPGEFVLVAKDQLPAALVVPLHVEQSLVCRAERIRKELGFQPIITFDDGVRQTVAWEQATPLADPAQFPLNYEAQDEVLAKRAS